jgi:hypothetical protein
VKVDKKQQNIEAKLEGHNKQYIVSLAIDHRIGFSTLSVNDGNGDNNFI